MQRRTSLWIGFLAGFVFGTLGMWVLAVCALIFQPVEFLTAPLFTPGRIAASFIIRNNSVGTPGTIFLLAVSGAFYGLIGIMIQLLVRTVRSR